MIVTKTGYAMGDRRMALRLATDNKHRRLDGLIGRFDDQYAYARYVQMTFAFRSAVEPLLAADKLADADLAPLQLLDLLQRDCLDLGIEVNPAPSRFALRTDRSSQLGALYVLEGSAMGARLLYSDAKKLGFGEDHAARHLAAQSKSTGRWPALLERLEQAEPFDLTAAIGGAQNVFQIAITLAEAHNAAE